MKVKDSNGAPLSEGDSVTLIKDLKVKGTSVTLKRGTLIKSIRLTSQFIAQPLRTLFNSSSNGTCAGSTLCCRICLFMAAAMTLPRSSPSTSTT